LHLFIDALGLPCLAQRLLTTEDTEYTEEEKAQGHGLYLRVFRVFRGVISLGCGSA
jgi:hypothetical protein